jgi:hypothetical protein
MTKRNLRVVQPGQRTGPRGKPVTNRILLDLPDGEYRPASNPGSTRGRDFCWPHPNIASMRPEAIVVFLRILVGLSATLPQK